jgi:hypothetical protein
MVNATETTAVTLEWSCGRCRKPYRTVPESKKQCRCPEPVAALRPHRTVVTVLPSTRRPLRPAGPLDEARARFGRRGTRVTVTFTGTVVGGSIANGEHLTLIVEDAEGHRHAIDPLGPFTVTEAEESAAVDGELLGGAL